MFTIKIITEVLESESIYRHQSHHFESVKQKL